MTSSKKLDAFWNGMSRVSGKDKAALQQLVAECQDLGAIVKVGKSNLMLYVPGPGIPKQHDASFLCINSEHGKVWSSGFLERNLSRWGLDPTIADTFYRELHDVHPGFSAQGVGQHDARRGAGVPAEHIALANPSAVPRITRAVKTLLSSALAGRRKA